MSVKSLPPIGCYCWEWIVSTVASGSIQPPNSCKPYYYNGYYYSFYMTSATIYYKKSSDGKTWDDAVSIVGSEHYWSVMGIDNKILLVHIEDDYFKVQVGTIEANYIITWGSSTTIGYEDSRSKFCWCYATKINGSRKMFINLICAYDPKPPPYAASDFIWVSDDDGDSWSSIGCCVATWTSLFWRQYQAIPFNDSNKLQEIHAPWTSAYEMGSRYRSGSTCSTGIVINAFRNQYYLGDQACAILIGSYVHLVYIDDSNNLLHKKVSEDGSWESVSTVKENINADAGLTLCYGSTATNLYIIYYEGTTIKQIIWDGTSYSSEELVLSGEANISYLTAYPAPLNGKILLNWYDGTNVRFFINEGEEYLKTKVDSNGVVETN